MQAELKDKLMGALIAVLHKEKTDATETALTMLSALSVANTDTFGIASPACVKIERTIDALQKPDASSNVIIGYRFSRILPSDRPQPTLSEDATMVFDGRTYTPGRFDSQEPSAIELLHHGAKAAKTFIKKSAGDYAFVLAEPDRLVAGRDAVGVRPLYCGENDKLAALASERKALWKIGLNGENSFPPGSLAIVDQRGFKIEPVKTLAYSEPKPIAMKDAARELEKLLKHSIAQRVSALKEVAIAFSGGLDSCVIARLVQESKTSAQLVHVSLGNQTETDHAREAADTLKMPIHTRLFKEDDVKETLPKVLRLTEEADPLKTAIGIPIYWAAEQASEMGLKIMLAGQGADELFGGYRRYMDDYLTGGEEVVSRRIFRDTVEICKNNLERDSKICGFHSVELRLPYATFEIARLALELPVKLKIDPDRGGTRKLVLRRVAENLGLPESISNRPKKAVQYATGVDKALRRLAKQQGSLKDFLQREFRNTLPEAA